MKIQHVAAVMSVFNRRDLTLRCLESLRHQEGTADLTVFVVDDASQDGTADAIVRQFPEVRLIRGTGDLFWNGGMRLGLEAALGEEFDFYWWLNDDVSLDEDALDRLLSTAGEPSVHRSPGIVVGSMRDPGDGHVTYGGVVRRNRWRPFRFELVQPTEVPQTADTMNGNCVLVPKSVAHDLGNLSPDYRQKMGDFDYGLRARKRGWAIWIAPGTYGTCRRHPTRRTDMAPLAAEIVRLWSVKELPFKPWLTFTRRWGGGLWPLYFVSPYLKGTGRLIRERLREVLKRARVAN